MTNYKLDLHTHSRASKDGGITEDQYRIALATEKLDVIAVTDHNEIEFAQSLQKDLGEKIIVGEEIWTREGEVIGLFLTKRVPPDLSLEETVTLIKEQNGLVYIPHPFCHNRFGVSLRSLEPVVKQVDILEHFNPRNLVRSDNDAAVAFATKYSLPHTASSDSHCALELGKTYATVTEIPTRENLTHLLRNAVYTTAYTAFWHLFCPKRNKLRKRLSI